MSPRTQMKHVGTKREGASATAYSCVRMGQPSSILFAGLNLHTDWTAGP